MAKVFSELETGVRMYLDESAQADFLNTEVDREINYAYQDLVGKVMDVYEKWYETTTPFTYALVTNQQEYLVDSSLIKTTRVEVNYAPNIAGSIPIRAVRVSMDEIQLNLTNMGAAGTFFNAGYYIHGRQDSQYIGFIPIPQVTDVPPAKSISVWGIASPSALVSPNDPVLIPFPDRFAKLIELKAASELLRKGQQQEAVANAYLTNYKIGLQEMMMFLKERQAEGVWMIEEVDPSDVDFQAMPPW